MDVDDEVDAGADVVLLELPLLLLPQATARVESPIAANAATARLAGFTFTKSDTPRRYDRIRSHY
ncbi:MAG: hypothetical protein JOZ98_19695 [Solirubrobacterales bacterium]|nr:hypothetical protein [Solirubrobacterales bacterium]MBV9801134.1 hypothetical protein [Solirubrobacterales bacterium]